MDSRLGRLRKQWSDQVLTALAVVLILMLFVFAPLQAVGFSLFQKLGFASALMIIGGAFFISGSPIVAVALAAAFIMASTGAILRMNNAGIIDVYLFAGALLLIGTIVGSVAARMVFAAGRVNYHWIVGAILVYLCVAVTFVALFIFVGLIAPARFQE